eukprot:scaffold30878_cov40-Phaeocystis_antarctica.AAC.1
MAMLDDANSTKKPKKVLSKSLLERNIVLKQKQEDEEDAVKEVAAGEHRGGPKPNKANKASKAMSPAARAKAERRAASGLGKSSTLRRNNSSTSLHSDSQESNDRGSDRESDKGSFRSSSGGEDGQEESFKAGPEGTSEYAKRRDELGDESFRGAGGGGGKGGGSFRGRRRLSKKHIDASAFPFIDAALLENAELFK